MARFFIIGATGEEALWLVDTQKQHVTALDADGVGNAGAAKSPAISAVDAMRQSGFSMAKGVAVAIATDDQSGLTAHQVFTGG